MSNQGALFGKVSVIIPAFNEGKTIASIVHSLRLEPLVGEIIVVDNKSTDRTTEKAKIAGASVLHCSRRGKGNAMKKGLQYAKNDVILFLDADHPYEKKIVKKMTMPVIQGRADLTKASLADKPGNGTVLLTKPLLRFLFPRLEKFTHPLSGEIAGTKTFFKSLEFEPDYGVDIGILIDACLQYKRIVEVRIGRIHNPSKEWNRYIMVEGISRAILKRAKLINN